MDATSDGAIIRLLEPDDSIAEFTALVHAAYRPLGERGFRYWGTHQTEDDTRERVGSGICLVAESDGRLVGTVVLVPPDRSGPSPWFDRPEVARFNQFAVGPARKGTGLGSRLLSEVESRAAALGAAELALDTAEGATDLIAWYERRGYRLVDHVAWQGTNYVSVVMSKRLAPEPPK